MVSLLERRNDKETKREKEGMTKRQNDKKTGRQTKASLSDKILTKPQLQNLDESLWSKSEQRFKFVTKLQFPNLHQTFVNTFPLPFPSTSGGQGGPGNWGSSGDPGVQGGQDDQPR